jgi:FKBP-type peptidyl-prolyl cis-trans isomerase (trigger factor)
MSVEVFPEIEIQESYKKIKLKKTIFDVTDQEVEEELTNIQNRFTHFDIADV